MFSPLAFFVEVLHKVNASNNVNYDSNELLSDTDNTLRILCKYRIDFLIPKNCCQ